MTRRVPLTPDDRILLARVAQDYYDVSQTLEHDHAGLEDAAWQLRGICDAYDEAPDEKEELVIVTIKIQLQSWDQPDQSPDDIAAAILQAIGGDQSRDVVSVRLTPPQGTGAVSAPPET